MSWVSSCGYLPEDISRTVGEGVSGESFDQIILPSWPTLGRFFHFIVFLILFDKKTIQSLFKVKRI